MGETFTLRLNAAKSIDYIEKCFKQKLSKIKFSTKNSVVEIGGSKRLPFFKYTHGKVGSFSD